VIQQVSSVYDLDWPTKLWFDTLPLARALLTLGSYSLPFVARALDLPELDHHEASADALQAARILLALSAKAGVTALADLPAGAPGYRPVPEGGTATPASRAPGDFSGLTATDVLAGESVVFTGKLLLSTRAEAQALVEHFGGTAQGSVTRTTTILVAGELDPRSLRPGVQLSRKLETAMDLAEKGQPIEVWTEDDFHQHLDVGRDQLEAATREQRAGEPVLAAGARHHSGAGARRLGELPAVAARGAAPPRREAGRGRAVHPMRRGARRGRVLAVPRTPGLLRGLQ
jgi:DNA polymerase-3 subunit epsilon